MTDPTHTGHRIINGTPVVPVSGRIDASTAADLEQELASAVRDGASSVVVDMTDLDYISSSGLRVLLAAKKNLSRGGGTLKIAAMKPFVREVFEISGFLRIFPVYPGVDEALQEKGTGE
ncbi:STAS domain-containing protein [Methanofollis fontis]|uniref:Anti-sigma factor antagonist n=1 Tax=Methanofollis fontis TaxID=2052832 RepID=A0A483CS17_9EURY|nr:STAS domain-containing protein [Methanofollis fontis]TAJ43855.1 anti-sigma factor antagonist [Methanofollis fontis]